MPYMNIDAGSCYFFLQSSNSNSAKSLCLLWGQLKIVMSGLGQTKMTVNKPVKNQSVQKLSRDNEENFKNPRPHSSTGDS